MLWTKNKSPIKEQNLLYFIVFVLMAVITSSNGVTVSLNRSAEHALREALIKYKDIRPVLSPQDKINITFSANILAVITLDTKKQMATTKLLIIQSWYNPFHVWDPDEYGGLDRVRLSHNEVWVPDIRLQNMPYNPSTGYTNFPLYKNWVSVSSNGTNVWKSLEMFDSECDINALEFPFDKQICYLNFSSETYDSTLLGINLIGKVSYFSKEEMKNIPSGEWELESIHISTQEVRSDPMSRPYVKVTIEVQTKRLVSFYFCYYILPCGVLAMLMFTTFIIPPENGERVGFCSSLLIALSVYLLLFSDMLPSSRHVSLLGILFVVVYLETALGLLGTVLVLKVFHAAKPVPKLLKFLYGKDIKKKAGNKFNKSKPKMKIKMNTLLKNKVADGMQLEEKDLNQLPEVVSISTEGEDQQEEIEKNEEWSSEDHQRCWSRIARSLDRFFFWFFVLIMCLSVFYIIGASSDIVQFSIFG